jgi:hypothetical protein
MDILIPTRLVPKKQEIYFRICFLSAGRIIVYYFKKQSIVVLSSIKTKYYILCKIIQEIV